MEMKKEIEATKAGAELGLEAFVEKSYEPVVDGLLEKLKILIPGGLDDLIIEQMKPSLKPAAKALLLAQIEKISEEV